MELKKMKNTLLRMKFFRLFHSLISRKKWKTIIEKELKERLEYEPSSRTIKKCLNNYIVFYIKFNGNIITDFFGPCNYRKSQLVWEEAFTTGTRFKWRDKIQDEKEKNIFDDKRLFYKNFNNFLGRSWIIIDRSTSQGEIVDFIRKSQGKIFLKDPVSMGGAGVTKITVKEKEYELIANNIITKYSNEEVVIEEQLEEHNDLYKFSLGAVNTLRIVTIIDDSGNPHVSAAVFRIGRKNSSVDNFSSGGMASNIDVETGILINPAKTKYEKFYIFHPDTGEKIVGYQIPDWNKYIDFALNLAMVNPSVRYVGWDIVRNTNGDFCVIEGNAGAGGDVLEASSLYGLLPVYNHYLHLNQ